VVVTVDGKTVTPAPASVQVRAGEPVTLTVTSRAANELHVHGVDVEKSLPAGTPVSVDLTFPDPGVYEVETHEPSLLLLRFTVR
jgi:plastocyanin